MDDTNTAGGWEGRLAKRLLVRHLQVSFPAREGAGDWLSLERWLPPDSEYASAAKARLRTVAVIGAGASWPLLALGGELADQLVAELLGGRQQDYRDELQRLQHVSGLDPTQFETQLLALCRTKEDESRVRERLAKSHGIRHPSLLTYEVIAHLLKHRFLDAVISFNFDELLDQSLDDEIGPREYARVVNARDCRGLVLDPDSPDYLPLYIKMHGTASDPETLRFTRDAYYWTPRPIVAAVEQLFDTDELVIMNLGCRLAGFDFHSLLRKPKTATLFHLDPSKLRSSVKREVAKFREKEGPERAKLEVVPCGKGRDAGEDFLPGVITSLVRELETRARSREAGPAYWRSVDRHHALVEILGRGRLDSDREHEQYLRRRAVLEVAFAVAKGRGVLSMASLVNERCGSYYDLYAAAAETASRWATVCGWGGLIEAPDAPDAYYVGQQWCLRDEPEPASRDRAGSEHKLRTIDPEALAAHVLTEIDVNRWPPRSHSPEHERLRTVLEGLQRSDEVEIHPLGDRVNSKVFVAPRVMPTHTAFKAWSRRLLESGEYDELRIVAESGGWLAEAADEISGLADTQVRLIVAYDLRGELLDTTFGDALEVRHLPWWRHNRHMRLACRNGRPVLGVYYPRRLRTSMVTPVFLREPSDLARIALTFQLLWDEAEAHELRISASAG